VLFGHIARLSEAVPANQDQALCCHVNTSLGRLLQSTWTLTQQLDGANSLRFWLFFQQGSQAWTWCNSMAKVCYALMMMMMMSVNSERQLINKRPTNYQPSLLVFIVFLLLPFSFC